MKQIKLPMVDNQKCQQQLRIAKDNSGSRFLGQGFVFIKALIVQGEDTTFFCKVF